MSKKYYFAEDLIEILEKHPHNEIRFRMYKDGKYQMFELDDYIGGEPLAYSECCQVGYENKTMCFDIKPIEK